MSKICNFPISEDKRCTRSIANNKSNCGNHRIRLSARQLGQNPTVYEKNGELHVWARKPNDFYCLIHGDMAYQVLCQLGGDEIPCCLDRDISWHNKQGELHRDDGPAKIWSNGTQEWYQHGELHREDGPAREEPDGTQHWYWHGQEITWDEYLRLHRP